MLNPVKATLDFNLSAVQHTGVRLEARVPGSGAVASTATLEMSQVTPEADGKESVPMQPLYDAGLPDGTYALAVIPINDGAEGSALVSAETFERQQIPPTPAGPIVFS